MVPVFSTTLGSAFSAGGYHHMLSTLRHGIELAEFKHLYEQDQMNPVHVFFLCQQAEQKRSWEILHYLLRKQEAERYLQESNEQGETLLMRVVQVVPENVKEQKEQDQLLKFLANYTAYIDFVDHQGQSALFHAVVAENMTAVALLLQKGASCFTLDVTAKTPFFLAQLAKNPMLTKMVNKKIFCQEMRKHFWMIAAQNDTKALAHYIRYKVLEPFYILRGKNQETMLMCAVRNRSMGVIDLLLQVPLDFSLRNEDNQSALSLALASKDFSLIEKLLHYGGWQGMKMLEPVTYSSDCVIETLYQSASRGSSIDFAFFLSQIVDDHLLSHMIDGEGRTLLICAVQGGSLANVELLLDRHVDCYVCDEKGFSALHYSLHPSASHIYRRFQQMGLIGEDNWYSLEQEWKKEAHKVDECKLL